MLPKTLNEGNSFPVEEKREDWESCIRTIGMYQEDLLGVKKFGNRCTRNARQVQMRGNSDESRSRANKG